MLSFWGECFFNIHSFIILLNRSALQFNTCARRVDPGHSQHTVHTSPVRPLFSSPFHHSNGDCVEVRWKADPFAAEVIHVHSGGKVDVVYDIDGSVGIILTANEHGLKAMGAEEKKGAGGKKKVCVVDGCPNKARYNGQLCTKHGDKHGGKPCSVDGCTAKAQGRGLCGNCLREVAPPPQ